MANILIAFGRKSFTNTDMCGCSVRLRVSLLRNSLPKFAYTLEHRLARSHARTHQKDSEGNVLCNSTHSEPQSNNCVECVLTLPLTETHTRGTTAVHSQWSCPVTPNQNQAQAVMQVEAGREGGGWPGSAETSAQQFAVFNACVTCFGTLSKGFY